MEGGGREKVVGDSRGNGGIAFAGERSVDCKVRHVASDPDGLVLQAAHEAWPVGVR